MRQTKTGRHWGARVGFIVEWANTQEDFRPSDVPLDCQWDRVAVLNKMVLAGHLIKVSRGAKGFMQHKQAYYRIAQRQ